MKKLFLCAAMAAFAFTSVNAQEVTFGAKAGLNLASISGDETDDLDGRTAFHLGAVAEISISEKFSVQPELLYSIQGAKFEEDGYEETLKYDYLNLPIMAKYYVAEGFSLEAGPQIGFLLSSKYEAEFDGESEEVDNDDASSIDFGLNFGVGYKMDSGLNFGVRYNLGLSNIYDGEGSDDYSVQNSVLQVSVGYFF
ncbi:porin family protein [Winogradskyella sediminis]|uniref:Outer membrane protein beta-barrel domain-containing protein n=1 Tax=Winogradskyella sediminis TaxID=1382466 RepID=A0A1H1WBN0_9FLAO|nr:porin family protein [Winogradskyella sediminis]SDS94060.1 Outer membrane protein beta-barrel domain-containing protein [Winogradskyella sediminis]